jgi:arylsulfatase A-like enzyme/SAM-dependent methyltransferase
VRRQLSLERLEEHRRLWEAKPELRAVYEVWFDLLLNGIPSGARVLEVGSGPGLLAEAARRRRPDLRWTSSDLLAAPWSGVVADAARLPFVTGSVDVVVGLDVLHHLPRPADFFREAARVLGGVGELRLVEPWITPLGWIVYRFFHQEECRLRIDPWSPFPGVEKEAFDGNAALPWRLVGHTAPWEWRHLGLEPPRRRRLNTFAYLLSLGFRESSLLRPGMVRPLLALDRWTALLSPLLALRAALVWRSAPPGRVTSAPSVTADGAPPGARDGQAIGESRAGRRATIGVVLALAALATILSVPRWWPGSPERWRVVRLLSAPREELDQSQLYEETEVRRISFASSEDVRGWRGPDGAPLSPAADGLRLDREEAVRRLIGPLGKEAEAVDVIEVEVVQESPSAVAVFWPRADGRFVSDRAMGQMPDGRGVARFVVAAHPRWQGAISRIAVQPSFAEQRVRLVSVRYLAYRLSPERAASAPREVRGVELGKDRRPAVAVTVDRPARLSVEVPRGARLLFGLGLPDHVSAEADFALSLVTSGSAERLLLEHIARRGRDEAAWSEHDVDLGRWAGQRVELSLRIATGETPGSAPIGFWANPRLRLPAVGERRPSVLLISADTLRADHLPLCGYGRPTTPHLDRWARERGVVFRHAVASAPWTLPSHVSLLTGVDAHRHGVSRQGPIPSEIPVLAELFRDAGYVTLATTGGGLVAPSFGFGRGFDVYRSREVPTGTGPRGELVRGAEQVLEWVSRHAHEPFFVFFHTYETHTPLEPREPFFTRLRGRTGPLPDRPLNAEPVPSRASDGFRQRYRFAWTSPLPDAGAPSPSPPPPGLDLDDPQLALDLYDSTIASLDAALGRVFARLEELDLADETIVAFTSDHGESFGENGLFAHTHLQDTNLMVPLVISPRPRRGPRSVDVQVRLVDVAPTLLEMAELAIPTPVQGRSLLPLMTGASSTHPEVAWSYSARTNWGLGLRVANRFKLIVPNTIWPALRGHDELYDLVRDPTESRNVASDPDYHDSYTSLRDLADRELAAVPQGVVVVVRCDHVPCFEGVLRGLGADRNTVTSADLACPCVEPVPGGTRLTARAGQRFSIVYEDVADGELGLALESAGPAPQRMELERRVGPAAPPFAVQLGAPGWELVEGAEDVPPVGLHVSYRGPSAEPHPEIAREMEERLRALGYIR